MAKQEKTEQFELTNEERLELEVLQLKATTLQDRLNLVDVRQQEWGAKIQEKYKVDLREYTVNVDSGVCQLRVKPHPLPRGEEVLKGAM